MLMKEPPDPRTFKVTIPTWPKLERMGRHLNNGGIIVGPSDSCIGVVGRPSIASVISNVDDITDHHAMAYSLAFPNIEWADRVVELTWADKRIFRSGIGPITLVGSIRPELPWWRHTARALHSPGAADTLGVRMPHQAFEPILARAINAPLLTAAMRWRGQLARSVDEAFEMAQEAVSVLGLDCQVMRWPGNRSMGLDPSTVGLTHRNGGFEVLRQGSLTRSAVLEVLASTPWQGEALDDVT